MAAALLFATASLLSGALAAGGSVLGDAFGVRGLVAGALLGGAAGAAAAAWLGRRRGWVAPAALPVTAALGVVASLGAAALAWTHAASPLVPALSTALVGAAEVAGRRLGAPSPA